MRRHACWETEQRNRAALRLALVLVLLFLFFFTAGNARDGDDHRPHRQVPGNGPVRAAHAEPLQGVVANKEGVVSAAG